MDNKHYTPATGNVLRSDNSVINWADGLDPDGTQRMKLAGSSVQLLVTATSVGVGSVQQDVGSFKSYVFEVWGSATSFSLHIETVGPSGEPRSINKVWDELNNGYLPGKDITLKGFYSVSVPSYTSIQVNVTSISGGNINVEGGLMP